MYSDLKEHVSKKRSKEGRLLNHRVSMIEGPVEGYLMTYSPELAKEKVPRTGQPHSKCKTEAVESTTIQKFRKKRQLRLPLGRQPRVQACNPARAEQTHSHRRTREDLQEEPKGGPASMKTS